MAYSPISEEIRDGPLKNRKCTDCFMCLVFAIFLICMFAVGIAGFSQGDPNILMYPHDSSGNQCGRPNRATHNYKYLYYPSADYNTDYKVCVKECPESSNSISNCYINSWVLDCEFKIRYNDNTTQVFPPYSSDQFLKRICIPDKSSEENLDHAFNKVIDEVYSNGLRGWASDIYTCWTAILIVLALAICISILYLLLLRYCIGFMI